MHNPRSNMNNAVGYARPARFAATGNPVALGTDGIGSDMLDEFRVAYARLRESDVTASPEAPWQWLSAGWDLMPDARDDTVTWNYAHMEPWHLAFSPGVRPERVEVAGEVVWAERPTHPGRRRRGARQSSRGRPAPLPPPRRPRLTRTTDMIRPTTRRYP